MLAPSSPHGLLAGWPSPLAEKSWGRSQTGSAGAILRALIDSSFGMIADCLGKSKGWSQLHQRTHRVVEPPVALRSNGFPYK